MHPLEAQGDLDALYGYACVRSCGGGSATGSLGAVGDKSADDSYDSSTLSDDDSTPHVSRSNSRSKEPWSPTAAPAAAAPTVPPPPLPPKLRHLPPVHVELGATMERRGRSRRRLPKPAARSKSLSPPSQAHRTDAMAAPSSPPPYRPPPYRPPPSVVPSHRAPITTYYLGARANPNPSPNVGSGGSPSVSPSMGPNGGPNPTPKAPQGPQGCPSPSMGPNEEGESYV